MESPQYLMRPSAATLKSFKCRSPIIPHASYGTAGRLAYRAPMVAEALPPLEHRLETVARAQGFVAFGIARDHAAPRTDARTTQGLAEERRVGTGGGRECRTRWSPATEQQKKKND